MELDVSLSSPKGSVGKSVGFREHCFYLLSLTCWEQYAQFMNISNCISQVCNPVGVQRLRMCFTFPPYPCLIGLSRGWWDFIFPFLCLLEKARSEESHKPQFSRAVGVLFPVLVFWIHLGLDNYLAKPKQGSGSPDDFLNVNSKYSTGH